MKWGWGLLLAAVASGQTIDLSILDKLASKAKSSINLSFDEDKLRFASKFLSGDDKNQADAKSLVGRLKAINVRVFEFDEEGHVKSADLDTIRAQLRSPGWSKMIEARDRRESAEIYMFSKAKDVSGMMIVVSEPRELVVVNIVGPIDMEMLAQLGGKFGIPSDIMGGSSKYKPKNKNKN